MRMGDGKKTYNEGVKIERKWRGGQGGYHEGKMRKERVRLTRRW